MKRNKFIDKQVNNTSKCIRMIAWVENKEGVREIEHIIERDRSNTPDGGLKAMKNWMRSCLNHANANAKAEVWIESPEPNVEGR